jgi:hypothetical protein
MSSLFHPLLDPTDEQLLRSYLISLLGQAGGAADRRAALRQLLPEAVDGVPADTWLAGVDLGGAPATAVDALLEAMRRALPALSGLLAALSRSGNDEATRREFEGMGFLLHSFVEALEELLARLQAAEPDPATLQNALQAGLQKAELPGEARGYWECIMMAISYPMRRYVRCGRRVHGYPLVVMLSRTAECTRMAVPKRLRALELIHAWMTRLLPPFEERIGTISSPAPDGEAAADKDSLPPP